MQDEKLNSQNPPPPPPPPPRTKWNSHHCVRQVAKKYKSVSQQAEVTWNVRTEWSEINDGSAIFEPWVHNKGRQNDRDYAAERRDVYRKIRIRRKYWEMYFAKRVRAVIEQRRALTLARAKDKAKERGETAEQGSDNGERDAE